VAGRRVTVTLSLRPYITYTVDGHCRWRRLQLVVVCRTISSSQVQPTNYPAFDVLAAATAAAAAAAAVVLCVSQNGCIGTAVAPSIGRSANYSSLLRASVCTPLMSRVLWFVCFVYNLIFETLTVENRLRRLFHCFI